MGLRELGVVVPLERYCQYWSAKLIPAVLEGNRQVATKVGIPLKTRPQSIATLESCCTRANVRRIGNTGSGPQSQASKLHREGSLLPRQASGWKPVSSVKEAWTPLSNARRPSRQSRAGVCGPCRSCGQRHKRSAASSTQLADLPVGQHVELCRPVWQPAPCNKPHKRNLH